MEGCSYELAQRLALLARHAECARACADALSLDTVDSESARAGLDDSTLAACRKIPVRWGVGSPTSGEKDDAFLRFGELLLTSLEGCSMKDRECFFGAFNTAFAKKVSAYNVRGGIPFRFGAVWVRATLRCGRFGDAKLALEAYLGGAVSAHKSVVTGNEELLQREISEAVELYALGALVPLELCDDAVEAVTGMREYMRDEYADFLLGQLSQYRVQLPSGATKRKEEVQVPAKQEAENPGMCAEAEPECAAATPAPSTTSSKSPSADEMKSLADFVRASVEEMTAERAALVAAATAFVGVSIHYRKRLTAIPRMMGDLLFGA